VKQPPTDLQILEEIYDRYYDEFVVFSGEDPERDSKVYVPIDISSIANHFGVDGDIVHGRLYYYLDHKYGITRSDGGRVPFFRFVEDTVPGSRHQVQFPILASAIASLRDARNRYLWATGLAGASFIIALLAFIVGVLNS
jgi:hypothetical protein